MNNNPFELQLPDDNDLIGEQTTDKLEEPVEEGLLGLTPIEGRERIPRKYNWV